MSSIYQTIETFFHRLPTRVELYGEYDPEYPCSCYDPVDATKGFEGPWIPKVRPNAPSRQDLSSMIGADPGPVLHAWLTTYWFDTFSPRITPLERNYPGFVPMRNEEDFARAISSLRGRREASTNVTSWVAAIFANSEYLILRSDDDHFFIDNRNGTVERFGMSFGDFLLRYGLGEP